MKLDITHIGSRLKTARTRHGLTLQELAESTGISASTLSRLESGQRQANLELLIPICSKLNLSIDSLVSTEPTDPRVRRKKLFRDGLAIEPLSPKTGHISTYKITYPPRRPATTLHAHEGYEWFYVVSGTINLHLGEQIVSLTEGEAAEFDTSTPHALSAAGSTSAQIISIMNESGVKIHTQPHLSTAPEQATDER